MTDNQVHPDCREQGHDWQAWFYWSADRWTRVCARWNCEGREEINAVGVASS